MTFNLFSDVLVCSLYLCLPLVDVIVVVMKIFSFWKDRSVCDFLLMSFGFEYGSCSLGVIILAGNGKQTCSVHVLNYEIVSLKLIYDSVWFRLLQKLLEYETLLGFCISWGHLNVSWRKWTTKEYFNLFLFFWQILTCFNIRFMPIIKGTFL